jgi:hypothetical protein
LVGSLCARSLEWACRLKLLSALPPPQALHVFGHLPFYMLLRPLRMRDWECLCIIVIMFAVCLLMLLLAMAPASGPLWRWWGR